MYKVLKNNQVESGDFKIVPIRFEDRLAIMQWRNEQIYHLRQDKPLTIADQDAYFEQVVNKLFDQEKPTQILFSFLQNNACIGYGGLVHINWIDKNAEISFIMQTELEKEFFETNWLNFLQLIEQVAFKDLNLHKLFTYAFDLRPHLYPVLQAAGYQLEARLKEHCYFDGKFIDVLIHQKTRNATQITIRNVREDDLNRLFNWSNDKTVRQQSYNTNEISFEDHIKWFNSKLVSKTDLLLIGELNNEPFGLVRFSLHNNHAVVGVLLDDRFRGKGLATVFLEEGCARCLATWNVPIYAYIKQINTVSVKTFEKAGFKFDQQLHYQGVESYLYILSK